jgi:hypothetical protein
MDEADQAAEADTAASAKAGMDAVSTAIPEAVEPLTPETLNTVRDLLLPAMDALTGGQLTPPEIPDFGADETSCPPVLAAPILGLAAMIASEGKSKPALKGYAFDATELLTTNDGLMEAVMTLDEMSRDKAVLKALKVPPREEAEEEEEVVDEVPAEDEADTEFEEEQL